MKIPFSIPTYKSLELNTLIRLLLVPGKLIRDYLEGRREGILPPVTAVLLFFSFYVLLSDAFSYQKFEDFDSAEKVEIGPVSLSFPTDESSDDTSSDSMSTAEESQEESFEDTAGRFDKDRLTYKKDETLVSLEKIKALSKVVEWFTLYRNPQNIDSKAKQFVATAENWIRGQGVFSFITDFLLFFPTLCILLRKKFTVRQNAVVTAYVLCQRCLFKIMAIIVTLGASDSLGLLVGSLLLALVFHQLLDLGWKHSLKKAILYWVITLVIETAVLAPVVLGALLYFNEI